MAVNDYVFLTEWRVRARPEEVTSILTDAPSFPRWWGRVFLSVHDAGSGCFEVVSRGRLPYRLHWTFQREVSWLPGGFQVKAWGDLTGTGRWVFVPDGHHTRITYLWSVRADKPLLRHLSFLLKPLFEANHRWAMARGLEGLRQEILRRRLLSQTREESVLA